MAVRGVNIGARGNEEVHNGVVGTADGVVQSGDALLIGLAWVIHLGTGGGLSPACYPVQSLHCHVGGGGWEGERHLTSFTACCTTSSSPVSAASNSSTSGLSRARRALRGDPTLRSTERISCRTKWGFSDTCLPTPQWEKQTRGWVTPRSGGSTPRQGGVKVQGLAMPLSTSPLQLSGPPMTLESRIPELRAS